MNLENILNDASKARSGYEISYFKEAGIPVYVLTIKILVLDKKTIGPIDEAILRAIKAGLSSPEDIYAFLGLPSSVIKSVFANLNKDELINYSRSINDKVARITLTTKGHTVLQECLVVRPVERVVKVCMDALTKRLMLINPDFLYKPSEMREFGFQEIPNCSTKRPEIEDIPLDEFDRLISRNRTTEDDNQELLAIKVIERREIRYLPYVAIFYRNSSKRSEIDVSFWNEEGASIQHESIFRELGGPALIGAEFLSGSSPVYPMDLSCIDSASSENDCLEGVLDSKSSDADTIQSVLCHEHPGLLKRALQISNDRLLIISPWIRHQVVDSEFIRLLEEALRRGVDVYIGYGIDENGGGGNKKDQKLPITNQAKSELDRLDRKYNNFNFVYVGNTHRKSLVCDDVFAVTTSFNWLSFRGDKGKPRDERGQLVNKKRYVDRQFEDDINLLKNGYKGGVTQ